MGLRVGGLATGIDTAALVDALIRVERRPLELVRQQKAELERDQSLFRELNTKLLALRDAAAALDNRTTGLSGPSFEEEFLAYSATSSDESVVSASAGGSASPGSYDVHVEHLASVGRRLSAAFASSTDPVAAEGETLSIDYGGDSSIDLSVGAGGASLDDLRDQINADPANGGNVRADVLFDGTRYRLVISGTQTGASHDLSVTGTVSGPGGTPFLDASLDQVAQDAEIRVLGVTVTRASNTISDAIPGLTLELRGVHANPTDVATVEVSQDDALVEERVQAFVDAFNEVVDFMVEQARYDSETGRAGPLSGDPTVRSIEQVVRRRLVQQFPFPGNPFTSLGQIGLRFASDGRLRLDSEDLREALAQNPQALRQLLGGDGTTDGAMTALARALDPLTDADAAVGPLAARNAAFETRIEGLDRQIERFELRLEKREELLVRQFSQLESAVAALQSQGNSLLGLFSGSSGT